VGLKRLEYECEDFEAGQHGEAGDHFLGWNVPRQRDNEVKIDEVSGRRNFDNPGNGMSCNKNCRRHGADPPKKESGMG
jgi:hypothetical protein